ncbi:OTU-like cysteine protease family protein [Tripterygium wilfordii]|uniref:OTU-like cysteine protease family protein n=1 Tax=Tripterygium wilfordii TaxID=458696 RepID=A0A7J7DEV5_TRIWF|nr:OVARIAN TUMOR DOMAIN-containing deubiquitinating enzyme 6-like [Tripterygium wilfordii]XP_038707017.1 OVARIAN TUMOR DOMAIN-containing deubiquitinating enzyme 6-like [Tripterygium wilfordii]XP_038707018.1 OVARIAN TUMOR DOMAIN-containing deubiquitinating enzyme 6-like [Tripterygium wilfordii]KAF5744890.1 OTU-like cysteine protease family protein [Tripterygium wilfordii]
MTRILVQRGSTGSSSSSSSSLNSARSPSLSGSPSGRPEQQSLSAPKDEEIGEELQVVNELLDNSGSTENRAAKGDDLLIEGPCGDRIESSIEENDGGEKLIIDDILDAGELVRGPGGLRTSERIIVENEGASVISSQSGSGSSHPPPPPVPPPKPSASNPNSRRLVSGSPNSVRRASVWPLVSTRSSPTGSRPSSPRSHAESEGYNSADEQSPCFASSYNDLERERQFEIDIRRAKGLEVKRMLEDGNCLFRAVADQVYGDSELYDLTRQMCIDYMERERDHFSQFITEGFTLYCRRKRRDKVYGNNVEIQALSEMYNRPIHIYAYSTEPINIFHGSYNTDTPPIRLSYHHGNHYNSLVDPRRLAIGAGLGFSSLRGVSVDRDQVKAAMKAQQDQQIDNALLAEGRFYSDLEVTEKEIERMVMEASRAEYLADDNFKGHKESSTSSAEPSSSGARSSGSETKLGSGRKQGSQDTVLSSSMQMLLSMGFTYLQAIEAYRIFGDDVDSMVCYLLETSNSSRRKGKATE